MSLGLLAIAGRTTPMYERFASSVQSFQNYVKDLNSSNLSPIERLVFSLVLANSKASTHVQAPDAASERRT